MFMIFPDDAAETPHAVGMRAKVGAWLDEFAQVPIGLRFFGSEYGGGNVANWRF